NMEEAGHPGSMLLGGFGTNTDADGRFRIQDLPECRVALTAVGEGCDFLTQEVPLDRDDLVLHLLTKPPPTPEPPAPAIVPVVAVTAASGGAILSGRLIDLAGNARAHETIELVAVQPEVAAGPWNAQTDAHGAFRIANLPAGTFDARWVRH